MKLGPSGFLLGAEPQVLIQHSKQLKGAPDCNHMVHRSNEKFLDKHRRRQDLLLQRLQVDAWVWDTAFCWRAEAEGAGSGAEGLSNTQSKLVTNCQQADVKHTQAGLIGTQRHCG